MHPARKSHTFKVIQARRDRARKMAAARWAADRTRRAAAAKLDPTHVGLEIVRRIVVIDHERTVREAVIYATDSSRAVRRKLRAVLAPPRPSHD